MEKKNKMTETDVIIAVDKSIEKVRTRSLDVSFNELYDMYKNGELIIDPDYQRLFRWSEEKQSQFIESLILEMPTPPIFVIEREEGVYELIDGLQRISSYLHFRGVLPDFVQEDDRFLRLTGCDIVKELNSFTFDELPTTLKIRLKRSFIRMEVIRRQSDDRLRYYMFKRLNTGGELLTEQEIRNCTIRIYDDNFNNFIIKVSQNPDFGECTALVDEELINKKYDQELVLRFFALKNAPDQFANNLADFLTNYMEKVTIKELDFDEKQEEEIFSKTFLILNKAFGKFAFSRINQKDNLVSTFMPYYFEAITLGLQDYIHKIDIQNEELLENLRNRLSDVKRDDEFKKLTSGGGKTKKTIFMKRVEFVRENLRDLFA